MQNEEKILIDHLKKMPPLNAALQNTLMLLNEKSSDFKKISGAILQDPVLTGRVLQIANSSFYGSQRQVTDLGIACSMLGLETLRGLVYTLILLTKFRNGPDKSTIDYNFLWKYCLRVACLVKNIAKTEKLDSSAAFTSALFHCMDLIIQDYFYKDIILQRIAKQLPEHTPKENSKIFTIIDTEYWNLIAILLEFWKFPVSIVSVFKANESPTTERYSELISRCALYVKKDYLLKSAATDADEEEDEELVEAMKDSEKLYGELAALLL